MRKARLLETRVVTLAEIDTSNRKRPVSDKAVAALKASVEELGFIKDPVDLRLVRHQGGKLRLLAGGHRLEVARQLGWEGIRADIWDCSDDWADLLEIDDNIAGAELTVLDTAVFLAERKRLYEKLHPEAKRGFAGGKARHGQLTGDLTVSSFAASTAEKFGVSESKVFRLLAAGAALAPDEVRNLRAAPRPITLSDMQAIAKIESAPERYDVVQALAEGTVKSAAQARKSYAARQSGASDPATKDPVEDAFKALANAWKRAPMAARRRFVEAENVALFNMLRDLDGGLSE